MKRYKDIKRKGLVRRPLPRTFDMQREDYALRVGEEGQKAHISCWNGRKPLPGDYLILKNGAHGTRYRVLTVDHCINVDPATMWMANLAFHPRPPFVPEEES